MAIGADPHDSPYDMAYYIWLIRCGGQAIAVDSGFNARSGVKRGHRLLRSPADGLRALGVEREAVETLIVTPLHYDHFGNADLFPASDTMHERAGDCIPPCSHGGARARRSRPPDESFTHA